MKVQSVAHEIRLQNWKQRVKECRTSGKTVQAWCNENNINTKTYYRWQRIVCQGLSFNQPQLPMKNVETTAVVNVPAVFAELSAPKSLAGKIALTIERRDLQIHVYCGTDRATMEMALLALTSL